MDCRISVSGISRSPCPRTSFCTRRRSSSTPCSQLSITAGPWARTGWPRKVGHLRQGHREPEAGHDPALRAARSADDAVLVAAREEILDEERGALDGGMHDGLAAKGGRPGPGDAGRRLRRGGLLPQGLRARQARVNGPPERGVRVVRLAARLRGGYHRGDRVLLPLRRQLAQHDQVRGQIDHEEAPASKLSVRNTRSSGSPAASAAP